MIKSFIGILILAVVGFVNYKFPVILSISILFLIGAVVLISILVALALIFFGYSEWREKKEYEKADKEAKEKGVEY